MQNLPIPARSPTPTNRALFTPERQALFLQRLAQCGNVRAACRSVRISRVTAYRLRRASNEFAELWDGAQLLARQMVEDVLADRALNGVEEKVFYHGEEVATRQRFSPQLLLAHLGRLDRLAHRTSARDAANSFDLRVERLESGEEEESYEEMIARAAEEGSDLYQDVSDGDLPNDAWPNDDRPDYDWRAEDAEMEELAKARGSFSL